MAKHKPHEYRFKTIADPVHSEIALSKLETSLINTRSFQRLRKLRQLGLAHLVYPSANHSRFAHSLGVFHLMGRVIDLMFQRGKLDEQEQRLLRLAALLHDVGHYPYSHLVETLDRDPIRELLLGRSRSRRTKVPYPSHEKIGEVVITQRSDIKEVLTANGVDPNEVAAIARGQHSEQKYNQLIHSTLDVDRMDYLVRDSIQVGVPYGRVDIQYLISNLDISSDNRLVLREKAKTAAEDFVVARYFMSKSVYLHRTVFGFEALLRQILYLMRKKKLLWEDGSKIEKLVTLEKKFLDCFHDAFIDGLVDQEASSGRASDPLTKLCRAFRDRRPPRLLAEVASLTSTQGQPNERMTRFIARRKDHLCDVARDCKIPQECWLCEDPKSVSFEKMGPWLSLDEASALNADNDAELIRIAGRDGKHSRLVEDQSSLLHHLSQLRFQMGRVYVVEEDEKRIKKAEDAVAKWQQP